MIRKGAWMLLLILLLSGCGRSQEPTQKALDFRTKLMQSEGCDFTADITADYGDKVYEFTVQVQYAPEETKLTVVSPEEISGISATVTEQGTNISFDGAALDFGKLANGYVSPVSASWLLGQCWTGEYISAAGPDGDYEKITYLRGYDDQELMVNTWLDEAGVPVQAEVFFGERRCLNIRIRDFRF